jgi:hypothetical protein
LYLIESRLTNLKYTWKNSILDVGDDNDDIIENFKRKDSKLICPKE